MATPSLDRVTYPNNLAEIRTAGFSRLAAQGITYLDHAGAALYDERQLEASTREACTTCYSNPHSQSDTGAQTRAMIACTRSQILSWFGADDDTYACIFTGGATAGLALIAHAFPWSATSRFTVLEDNHNSVLGIREVATRHGASYSCCSFSDSGGDSDQIYGWPPPPIETTTTTHSLFAFPAESNFSGRSYPVALIVEEARQRGYTVLVDAAKAAATSPLSLKEWNQPDMVVLSFYKMFGAPTGLGALLVRRDTAAAVLCKHYFGGGTVVASLASEPWHRARTPLEERWEDGTLSYLSIASLRHGFEVLTSLGGMSAIQAHVHTLTSELRTRMAAMHHPSTNRPLFVMYPSWGSVVVFNVQTPQGLPMGHRSLERLAISAAGIQLRSGCFCNPGACHRALGLTSGDVRFLLDAGHHCWDDNDLLAVNLTTSDSPRHTGVVRLSLGYMTSESDLAVWFDFCQSCLLSAVVDVDDDDIKCEQVSEDNAEEAAAADPEGRRITLTGILLYPIKSCAAHRVDTSWRLNSSGLEYDREWCVVSLSPRGRILSQKDVPTMCRIHPRIDFTAMELVITADGIPPLHVPLIDDDNGTSQEFFICNGTSIHGESYKSDHIQQWFTSCLGIPCTLARSSTSQQCNGGGSFDAADGDGDGANVNTLQLQRQHFSNESQLLLVTEESAFDVATACRKLLPKKEIGDEEDNDDDIITAERFRPNFIVRGAGRPWVELNWSGILSIHAGNPNPNPSPSVVQLPIVGPCHRCAMVNVNQRTARRARTVFRTLANLRHHRPDTTSISTGAITFGLLLSVSVQQQVSSPTIHIGDYLILSTD